jgi:methyltransferase (TIGR00027 family)
VKSERASNTAKVIAASTILLASDRRTASLVAPGAADLCRIFLSGSAMDRWLAKSVAWPFTRMLWRGLERLTLPGIMEHYWHRKGWIESRCQDALTEGFERLVVIGAGFDTLGYRLSERFPKSEVVELDHPATQGAKLRALVRDSTGIPSNLKFVDRDLSRQSFPSGLFDDSKSALFVIEGVLMYLSPSTVNQLFDALRGLPAQRVRAIFSFMTEWSDGMTEFRPRSWLIDWWLAWRKEPFTWGIEPDAMEDFLSTRGFAMKEQSSTRELSKAPVSGTTKLEGENLVLCEFE